MSLVFSSFTVKQKHKMHSKSVFTVSLSKYWALKPSSAAYSAAVTRKSVGSKDQREYLASPRLSSLEK